MGINDDPHAIEAAFVQGYRPMRALSEGIGNDLLFMALGGECRVTESISFGAGYRAEFRQNRPSEQSCNLSSTFRF